MTSHARLDLEQLASRIVPALVTKTGLAELTFAAAGR
jgi:hypothetical protein